MIKYSEKLQKTAHGRMACRTRTQTHKPDFEIAKRKKNLSLTAIKLHKMTHYIRAPEIMPTQVGT